MTDRSNKKPTSFDVARLAGVHRSAVSRAFSGRGRMAEETRQKVLAAADELGYRVNYLARGLQGSSSQLVGIVASRLDTPYRATQVRVLAQHLLNHGYSPVLVAAEDSDDLTGLMDRLLHYAVSGMIVTSDTPPAGIIEECSALSVPVVLINRDQGDHDADRVQMDVEQGGKMAFDILRTCGGSQFAVLLPQRPTYSVSGRALAFARNCNIGGFPCLHVPVVSQDYEAGVSAADDLMKADTRPDAVFATTDLLALGLLDGLRQNYGISVPQQIQVLGFDDIPQAAWLGNSLSTLRQDADDVAQLTVELMLRRIEDPNRLRETRLIGITPRLRKTTRQAQTECD